MKTVGTILKEERKKLGLDLKTVSQKTKISLKILQRLEKNQFQKLPGEPYCSLFVKDYAQFLSLPPQKIVAICRRDLKELKKPSLLSSQSQLSFTPKFTVSALILVSIFFFSSYLFYQYRQFQKPPSLEVNWPATESISKNEFEVRGLTDPENVVRVNEKPIIVDPKGIFFTIVKLEPGANTIRVEAVSLNKKATIQEKIVGYTSMP